MEDNCNEAIPWFKYGNRQAGPISFKALQRLWPRILSFSQTKNRSITIREPSVTIFELEDQIIKTSDLQIKIFDDYCEEWAQFVLLNRDRSHTHPAHTYDIVIGPIADDGVTYQLRRYSMGDISMSRLIEELKYAKGLTIQYYFGTEHALSYLKKL